MLCSGLHAFLYGLHYIRSVPFSVRTAQANEICSFIVRQMPFLHDICHYLNSTLIGTYLDVFINDRTHVVSSRIFGRSGLHHLLHCCPAPLFLVITKSQIFCNLIICLMMPPHDTGNNFDDALIGAFFHILINHRAHTVSFRPGRSGLHSLPHGLLYGRPVLLSVRIAQTKKINSFIIGYLTLLHDIDEYLNRSLIYTLLNV